MAQKDDSMIGEDLTGFQLETQMCLISYDTQKAA